MKNLKFCEKIICVMISLSLLIQMMPITVLASETENVNSTESTAYVVKMKDANNADAYAQQFIEEFKEQEEIINPEIMLDHDVMVTELTDKEAAKLEKQSDVLFVEEDILLDGNVPEEFTSEENEFLESLEMENYPNPELMSESESEIEETLAEELEELSSEEMEADIESEVVFESDNNKSIKDAKKVKKQNQLTIRQSNGIFPQFTC